MQVGDGDVSRGGFDSMMRYAAGVVLLICSKHLFVSMLQRGLFSKCIILGLPLLPRY